MKIAKAAAVAALVLGMIGLIRGAAAGTKNPTIFVANDYDVTAYPVGSKGDVAPIALTTDMAAPSGIARDASGRIYVTNSATNTVTVYPANASGNVPPLAVIGGSKTRLSSPAAIALDASGKIYVANSAEKSKDSITVYPPLATGTGILNEAPVATIAGSNTLLDNPSGIALASQGDIYVANELRVHFVEGKRYDVGRLTVYPAGSNGNVTPVAAISGTGTGLAYPDGIALDSDGNIYVVNFYTANVDSNLEYDGSITIYSAGANGDASPIVIIAGDNTGLAQPQGLALDSGGNLYVADGSINVYSAGSSGNVFPAASIGGAGTGLAGPIGIALDSGGGLYVLNSYGGTAELGSVTAYRAGSSGDAVPNSTITSNFTGIGFASSIAVDATGKIYVANSGDSITIYPAGGYATGAPIATIAGDNTGLNYPFGIALDSTGNIFALNSSNPLTAYPYAITAYPSGSSGNVTPTATLTVDGNGESTPSGIAVGRGNLYVANQGNAKCNRSSCFPGTPDNIAIYSSGGDGNAKPIAVIEGANTNLASPSAVAVDHIGNIYAANDGLPACKHACNQCIAIPNGAGSVTVYAPGSDSNSKPIRRISGGNTGLIFPSGIALDSSGNIYVLNSTHYNYGFACIGIVSKSQEPMLARVTAGSMAGVMRGDDPILIFAAGSDGDVAPVATIGGPFAGLSPYGASGIAIGPAGP